MHRHHGHQVGGEKALEHVEHGGFDGGSRPFWYSTARSKAATMTPTPNSTQPNRKEEVDGGVDPGEVEDLRAHVAHLGEHVRDGIVKGVEEPLHQVVPDGVDDGVADALEYTPPIEEAMELIRPSTQLNTGDPSLSK